MNRSKLYRPLDAGLFRAPLLPFEQYLAGFEPHAEGFGAMRDPGVRLALLVGSRSVFEGWERAERAGRVPDGLRGKTLRYLIRMATRPTPYGLFAGVALSRFGTHTDLTLGSEPRRRSRPDMGWLLALVARLEARLEVRRQLRLFANPAAQQQAGRIVLREKFPRASDEPAEEVSVRATSAVRLALSLARTAIPYETLCARLTEATGADAAKVEKLLTDLWQQTLLLTDLAPPFTTPDPARELLARLAPITDAAPERAALAALLADLAAWDALEPDNAAPALRELTSRASALASVPGDTCFQTDSTLSVQGGLVNRAVADEAARAAELLLRLSPAPQGPASVTALRQQFTAKYNEGREVPVLELLDPDVGLGPLGSGALAPPEPRWNARRDRALLALACRALRSRERVVELDERLLAELQTWAPSAATAPRSLDVCVQVAARSAAAIDAGDFQLVIGPNLGASAAGRSLGRFACLLGDESLELLRSVEREVAGASPEPVAAELVYRPRRFRSANLVVRPPIRQTEIDLGGRGREGMPAIPIDELVAGVRNERFYLRRLDTGEEVRVTAGHMLNTTGAPEVVRFLADVGEDGRVQLEAFSWGPAEGFPFLPRVQSGRAVLRPAEWRVSAAERDRAFPSDDEAGLLADLARWRAAWDVPRYVFLTDADNRLLLDLEDGSQSGELFHELRQVKDQRALVLQEVLPAADQLWAEGPHGHYYAELVIPLVLAELAPSKTEERPTRPAASAVSSVTREPSSVRTAALRPPGSEWLYLKLYGGANGQDDLIAGPVRDFAAFVLAEGLAQRWFFLRYADPAPHLRIRFGGTPADLTNRLLPAACDWASGLLAGGSCTRFAFDTYDREVERYGGAAGVAVAEDVFCVDSAAVAAYQALLTRRETALDKETLAVLTLDNLLDGLGLSACERTAWLRGVVANRGTASAEYRKRQKILRVQLGALRAGTTDSPLGEVAAGARRALVPCGERLADLARRAELSRPTDDLHGSLVHMHCNRLLGVDRAAETRALALLLRTSESLHEAPLCPATCAAAPTG
jgi:thiopeptide-type bacteriocin biosynthesis protein